MLPPTTKAHPAAKGATSDGEKREIWGNYELVEMIKVGGMGMVYKAVEIKPIRRWDPVALKRIRPEIFSPATLRRFLYEAEAATNLTHPNIVPIYHFGEHEGEPFYSMKFVDGRNLREWMRQPEMRMAQFQARPTAASRALQERFVTLLAKVAQAVAYAHRRGVLHRDLKPDNILVDADDEPHLTDFGLARGFRGDTDLHPKSESTSDVSPNRPVWNVSSEALTARIEGTLQYMPPEEAAVGRLASDGEPMPEERSVTVDNRYTVACDIYSLGAILYHFLAGQVPFEGPCDSTEEVKNYLLRIRHEAPLPPTQINPAIDKELEAICLKCLRKRPEDRYLSARELADELERWARNEPVAVLVRHPIIRAWRWYRRQRKAAQRIMLASLIMILSTTALAVLVLVMYVNSLKDSNARIVEKQKELLRAQWPWVTKLCIPNRDLQLWGYTSPKQRTWLHKTRGTTLVRIGIHYLGPDPRDFDFAPEKYKPLFSYLEQECRPPVQIDLILYKNRQAAMADLRAGNIDILRACTEAVLNLRETMPDNRILCEEIDAYPSNNCFALVARSGLTQDDPAAWRGRTAVFAEAGSYNADILARDYLRRNGLHAHDFTSWTNVELGRVMRQGQDILVYAKEDILIINSQLKPAERFAVLASFSQPDWFWLISENYVHKFPDVTASLTKTFQALQLPRNKDYLPEKAQTIVASTNNFQNVLDDLESPIASADLFFSKITEGPFQNFEVKGLMGMGRVPADICDALGPQQDTLGGFGSGFHADTLAWKCSGNPQQGYSCGGDLLAVSDAGPGGDILDYHPRILRFTCRISCPGQSDSNALGLITLTNTAVTMLHNCGTHFTGCDASDLAEGRFPISDAASPGHGHQSLDAEALARAPDGGWYVGDEYGPFIYKFSRDGALEQTLVPPPAYLPKTAAGATRFAATNLLVSGRRPNRGFEGLSVTPDGKLLLAMLQSPLVQDGGMNPAARNNRLLLFDLDPASTAYQRPVAEYVYRLALYPHAGTNRATVVSEILALSQEQFLVLERDTGDGPAAYQRVVLASLAGATNILDQTPDTKSGGSASAALPVSLGMPGVAPITRRDFIDLLEAREVVESGPTNPAPLITEMQQAKWESLALVPWPDPGESNDFLLLIGSDNNFQAPVVYLNGQAVATNSEPKDTLIMAWRVTIPPAAPPKQPSEPIHAALQR